MVVGGAFRRDTLLGAFAPAKSLARRAPPAAVSAAPQTPNGRPPSGVLFEATFERSEGSENK